MITRTAPLGSVSETIRGVTFKPVDVIENPTATDLRCMRTKNVQAELDQSDVWAIPRDKLKRTSQVLREGDVLMSTANSWNLVGKACFVPALNYEATFGGFVTVIRPRDESLDPRYFYRYITSARIQALLRSFARQTTNIANLDMGRVSSLPVPIPPLPEQRRIASILDHADALRAKRRQAIVYLDELSKSIFHHMFSMFEWQTRLDSIIAAGPTNGLYRPASDYGAGVPILRIDGFASGAVLSDSYQWKRLRANEGEIEQYALAPGDLVVNRVNALSHLGKSALISDISEPSVYESNMMRIRIDANRANGDFVLAWLQTRRAKQQILRKAKKSINQASINQADVKSLVLPLPPLELQCRFAERVEAVRVERAASERFNASADDLFYSLQSRAFRGEL